MPWRKAQSQNTEEIFENGRSGLGILLIDNP